MHNQQAGLSQQLATQRITERQQQAAQARLAQSAGRSRRRRHQWLTRRWWQLVRRPGTALTRALIIGATLAAMHLAGLTAVAHAQANDPDGKDARRRAIERQSAETERDRPVAAQQTAADAALQRVLARERFSIPSQTPDQPTAPAPPQSSGQPSWLVASLGGFAAGVALAGGLAVLAAKRTRRRARLEHAA
jgi:hypothetical protein